jgi:aryl-alcohol dehydrogenase-like predicted oxidoreductase
VPCGTKARSAIVTILIAGSSFIAHLEENGTACGIALLEADIDALERFATVAR